MTGGIRKITIYVLILIILFSGCTINNRDKEKLKEEKWEENIADKLTEYIIDLDFYPEEKEIEAVQETVYINNEKVPVDKIYFHLYPNAFRERETAPFLFDDLRSAYYKGFEKGYIDIEKLYIDGRESDFILGGKGNTIMEVKLREKLDIGESISVKMEYRVKLPPSTERFGYKDGIYNFGNWYPVIAVYDESGWNLDPYYAIGDPFYGDISNYSVTIRAPRDIIIASTGSISDNKINKDIREWKIEAKKVRDFAWVAGKDFKIVEKNIDGILLRMYFLSGRGLGKEVENKVADIAVDSLNIYNRVFGKYPYGQYSIVQTNFPSGMEYPGIVFIGKQFYDMNYMDILETIIVHETAHQWWYGVVGNDQVDEPWLDESFASYSEVIYFSEKYGENKGGKYHKYNNEERYYETIDSLKDKPVLRALNEFKDWNDYSFLVYVKGAVFLDDMKDIYGKEVFYQILKTYYERYKFKIATTEDFLNVCEEVTGDELDSYFEKWLE